MNYKNAAGRNWARASRKQRQVHLADSSLERWSPLLESTSSVGSKKEAPGRNWSRERPRWTRVHLDEKPSALAGASGCPLRERGGGDHDQAFEYRAPSSRWTFPFTARQYARLLALRGRASDRGRRLLPART